MNTLLYVIAAVPGVMVAIMVGFAAQRLLGIRLGWFRLVLTGGFALLAAPIIITGVLTSLGIMDLSGPAPVVDPESGGTITWLTVLAAILTLLASMVFIVVIEAFAPLGSIPPARVWGRGISGRLRRARRYWQIVGIALRQGLGKYLRQDRNSAVSAPGSRTQLGRVLAETLNAGGVTFIKMGQILATRRDLLPPEITAELSSLQDDAHPVPADDVQRVLADEYGQPVGDVFAEFDPEPLSAASVGQVHAARLHSGEHVVVKVQRPGIRRTVERDLDIATRLAARLERSATWARDMGFVALAEGLANALREELDYRVETENIEAVLRGQPANSRVYVPSVHQSLCTERVLVMERLDGTPLNNADGVIDATGADRTTIARTLLEYLIHQIVITGVFHADPHGGNVLLLNDGRVGLLDFGSVGRIDGKLRGALQRLLLAVDRGDPVTATDALLELVPRPDGIDEERLERAMGRFMARHVAGSAAPGMRMFGDLFRLVSDHGLSVPPELAAVFRSLATAEGTLTLIAPEFDLVGETRALAAAQWKAELQPHELKESLTDEIATLIPVLRRLPRRVDRIADAAEHGRLSLNIRALGDARDRQFITGLFQEGLVAFLAAGVGLMAVMLLGASGGPQLTASLSLHELLAYNLMAVSAILALRVLAKVFRRS